MMCLRRTVVLSVAGIALAGVLSRRSMAEKRGDTKLPTEAPIAWKEKGPDNAGLIEAVRQLQEQVAFLRRFNVPAGTIGALGGTRTNNKLPVGWLVCDGTPVSQTKYPALFSAIGTTWGKPPKTGEFNLPDLRGRFLRGVDKGAGHDPNAAARTQVAKGGLTGDNVGSLQPCATSLPTKPFSTSTNAHSHKIQGKFTHVPGGGKGEAHGTADSLNTHSASHSHSIEKGGDDETRPENCAVLWIIRI